MASNTLNLLIDAGNTRVKWGWQTGEELVQQGEWLHRNLKNKTPPADWLHSPAGPAGRPQHILAANVAGEALAACIRSRTKLLFDRQPEFIKATQSACGVTNGYDDPELIGADRWAAIIGAFSMLGGPVCVVDVGTAVTVDVLDSSGLHLGGVIAPGLRLATGALGRGTNDIAVFEASSIRQVDLLATNTQSAVYSGALYTVAGLVDRVVIDTTERLGSDPRLIVTGGDGPEIMGRLRSFGEYVPDLVLNGLAVIAKQQ